MTTQRRGELAIRFFGLATAAEYLVFSLPAGWPQVPILLHAMFALSAALVAAAGPLSWLLFAERDAPGRIHDDDIVYIGVRTYGFVLIVSTLVSIPFLLARPSAPRGMSDFRVPFARLSVAVVFGSLLLWLPPLLQRLLPSASPPDRAGGRQVTSYVESALITMGVYVGGSYLLAVLLAVFEDLNPMTAESSAASRWAPLVAQVVSLLGAALLLYFHRSIAGWFHPSDEDEEAPVGPGAGACMLAAFTPVAVLQVGGRDRDVSPVHGGEKSRGDSHHRYRFGRSSDRRRPLRPARISAAGALASSRFTGVPIRPRARGVGPVQRGPDNYHHLHRDSQSPPSEVGRHPAVRDDEVHNRLHRGVCDPAGVPDGHCVAAAGPPRGRRNRREARPVAGAEGGISAGRSLPPPEPVPASRSGCYMEP